TSGDAAGGTTVTVLGTGFVWGASLSIGGVSAVDVVVLSTTAISATMPALPPGTLNDVSVANPPVLVHRPSATAILPGGWMAALVAVPREQPFHAFIEKIFRNGITAGCGGGRYCPGEPVRRDQMAVLLLKGMHDASYAPPACTAPGRFLDVACPGPYTDWI